MHKISLIIPVYNSEKYLEKCLDSVFSQSFDDYEVILVNDGSADGSQDIIDAYKMRYPEVITALKQPNSGQASARNTGLAVARGEYVFFLDADDYLHSTALDIAYAKASGENLDIVCFNYFTCIDENAEKIPYRLLKSSDTVRNYIINEASCCNKLIRRKLFEDNLLRFTEGLIYEDFQLIPQLALYTDKIGFIDDYLYYYVIHNNSTMRAASYSAKFSDIYTVTASLKERFYGGRFHNELEWLFIEHLLHCAVLRYLAFPEGRADIRKISGIMRENFPGWFDNKYYKMMGFKYKIVCTLAYLRFFSLLKFLLKI